MIDPDITITKRETITFETTIRLSALLEYAPHRGADSTLGEVLADALKDGEFLERLEQRPDVIASTVTGGVSDELTVDRLQHPPFLYPDRQG